MLGQPTERLPLHLGSSPLRAIHLAALSVKTMALQLLLQAHFQTLDGGSALMFPDQHCLQAPPLPHAVPEALLDFCRAERVSGALQCEATHPKRTRRHNMSYSLHSYSWQSPIQSPRQLPLRSLDYGSHNDLHFQAATYPSCESLQPLGPEVVDPKPKPYIPL